MKSPRKGIAFAAAARTLACLLLGFALAGSALAEPPSFLADTPARKKVAKSAPKIRITRNAQVAEPSSSEADVSLKKKQQKFSEDELLPPRNSKGKSVQPTATGGKGVVTTIVSSLAIVIGAFLLLVWFSRNALPRAALTLPNEAVELLGKTTLSGKQQLQLLRVGNKLLLVNITSNSAETLTEITDPVEVERLCGMCSQDQPGSISATFRQVLNQFGSEPTTNEFAR